MVKNVIWYKNVARINEVKKLLKRYVKEEDCMLNPSICARECDKRFENEKYLDNCAKHAPNISVVAC